MPGYSACRVGLANILPVLVASFLTLFLPCALHSQEAATTGMSVQVERTAVRTTPAISGSIIGYLGYGIRVSVVETKDGWSRILIATESGSGWVRASALIVRKIPGMTPGAAKPGVSPAPRTGVSDSEVVLAGRGFTRAIEDSYRASTMIDYSWIDRMEALGVDEAESIGFIGGGR